MVILRNVNDAGVEKNNHRFRAAYYREVTVFESSNGTMPTPISLCSA
jgi:hypothetical protein